MAKITTTKDGNAGISSIVGGKRKGDNMYCALCKWDIREGFTNPKSHKPGCPIFAGTGKVTEVIIKEAQKPPKTETTKPPNQNLGAYTENQ